MRSYARIVIIPLTMILLSCGSFYTDILHPKYRIPITVFLGGPTITSYSAIGELDESFGNAGVVTHLNAEGRRIAFDRLGNIFVTGYSKGSNNDMLIWKYKPDGKLDESFGTMGMVTNDGAAGMVGSYDFGIAIEIDQKDRIIIAGYSIDIQGKNNCIVWRYNQDGTPDKSFGNGGIVIINSSSIEKTEYSDFTGVDFKLDINGNIIVACQMYGGYRSHILILRLNTYGNIDTGFGSNGIIIIDGAAGKSGWDDFISALILDKAGKILIVGHSINTNYNWSAILIRYNNNGNLDDTFGNHGIINTNTNNIGIHEFGNDIFIDKNNKILVAGSRTNNKNNYDIAIWRFNNNGSPDNSFGKDGVIIIDNNAGFNKINVDDFANSIITDKNNKILIIGYSSSGDRITTIFRLNSDGSSDDSFGMHGIYNIIDNRFLFYNNDMRIDETGNLLITGFFDTTIMNNISNNNLNINNKFELNRTNNFSQLSDFPGMYLFRLK